jgi:recombination protein RecT
VPALKDRGAVIQYYAVFHTKAGGYGLQVMSVEDVQQYASKYSKAYGSDYSPWKSNFDAMAKKTVLKQALKYAPISTEFVREVAADETIKTSIDENMLDIEDETIIDVTPSEEPAEESKEA